ncbi:hypothetical protein [Streptomyces sp. NPDC048442]|uniref:hypothetical protein n=1 Tax=Streptomyces sp. NPDC048442 TaxID=3154823 RepID=UPI003421623A
MPAPSTEPQPPDSSSDFTAPADLGTPAPSRRPRRLLAAGTALLVAGAAAYGIYALTSENTPTKAPVPTAAVTYAVTGTGTADITYLATSEQGTATTEKAISLPWKKTVQVPLGKDPSVKVQLPQQGGEATCTLAIRDQHKQRATASGAYGRTTCTTSLDTARP